jgi:hypothetical protein
VQLREQVRAALQRVQAGETKHVQPLEPEAARMECDGRNRFAYNAQAVVDAKHQIIVAADVTNAPGDSAQLVPMIAQAQAACEPSAATPTTLADGGYANAAQLSAAEQAGYPVVTPPSSGGRDPAHPYHAIHFRHEAVRQVVICPQGRELPLQRVRQKRGQRVEVYRSAKVCKDCPVRAQCTSDRHGRTIDIQPGRDALLKAHLRWQQAGTLELYSLRAPIIEPVFAQVKQQMGFRRWTVRGLTKVRAQWSLLATTWNLRVIFRFWQDGQKLPRPSPPQAGGPHRASSSTLGRLIAAIDLIYKPHQFIPPSAQLIFAARL